ncbi:MAG: hypothetical protein JWN41_1690, partial [Thermoleophilia bacterium]|nr:hypothetical protein [Thermoleophilia bacterium]
MASLAKELEPRFASISYTQRGVVPSVVTGALSVSQSVQDAIAVLDSRGIAKAWLIGHSWGGYLALQIARQHPERV